MDRLNRAACGEFNIDQIIRRLTDVRHFRIGNSVEMFECEIIHLCERARAVIVEQPMLVELKAPIVVCSNLFGNFAYLLQLFRDGAMPSSNTYLFVGDTVDGSKQSLETICLLLAYKIKYPNIIYILSPEQGVHKETFQHLNEFYKLCKRRYSPNLSKSFSECLSSLPTSARINNEVFSIERETAPTEDNVNQLKNFMNNME